MRRDTSMHSPPPGPIGQIRNLGSPRMQFQVCKEPRVSGAPGSVMVATCSGPLGAQHCCTPTKTHGPLILWCQFCSVLSHLCPLFWKGHSVKQKHESHSNSTTWDKGTYFFNRFPESEVFGADSYLCWIAATFKISFFCILFVLFRKESKMANSECLFA